MDDRDCAERAYGFGMFTFYEPYYTLWRRYQNDKNAVPQAEGEWVPSFDIITDSIVKDIFSADSEVEHSNENTADSAGNEVHSCDESKGYSAGVGKDEGSSSSASPDQWAYVYLERLS